MTDFLSTKYSVFLKRYGHVIDSPGAQVSKDKSDLIDKNESIKSQIAYIYKIKYNRTFNAHDIKNLEKEARRGRVTTPDEPIIYRKEFPPIDPALTALKKQHNFTSEGIKVLKLPKMAFGMHKTYNDTDQFLSSHIMYNEPGRFSPEALSEIEDLKKMLRKYKKKLRNKSHFSRRFPQTKVLNSNNQFDIFKTKGGELICKKQDKVLQAYEDQANKYGNRTHSDTETPSLLSDLSSKIKKPLSRQDIAKTSYRLHRSARTACESPYVERLKTKYQILFNSSFEEPIPLPKLDIISNIFN